MAVDGDDLGQSRSHQPNATAGRPLWPRRSPGPGTAPILQSPLRSTWRRSFQIGATAPVMSGPTLTVEKRRAARDGIVSSPLPRYRLSVSTCAAKVRASLLKARSALSCWGNPHHRQIFDSAKTENRSTADSKNFQNQKRASLSTRARTRRG